MSAGICIMNRNAIAMAADSAVTVGDHVAIHNSANKLFSLSKVACVSHNCTRGLVPHSLSPLLLLLHSPHLACFVLRDDLFLSFDFLVNRYRSASHAATSLLRSAPVDR